MSRYRIRRIDDELMQSVASRRGKARAESRIDRTLWNLASQLTFSAATVRGKRSIRAAPTRVRVYEFSMPLRHRSIRHQGIAAATDLAIGFSTASRGHRSASLATAT